jgi:Na+/melibiose symporter-like transporter
VVRGDRGEVRRSRRERVDAPDRRVRAAGGTFEVGLLSAAVWLPWLLIGLPVGVRVDRWRCRPIMLIAAATSLVALLVVPVAAWSDRLSIALLLAVGLVTGTASVVFQTAYSAYLPIVLAPDDQPEGNAKLHGSASAAQIAGLGSGGVIAQVAGAVNGLVVNAAAFLVALLCLARIRHREPRTERAGGRTTTLVGEVLDGLRLIAGDPWFRALTLFGGASNLALMGYQTIQVVFLVRTVGLAPGTVGGLLAATSAGGVAGALVVRRVADRIGTARAVLLFEVVVPVLGLLMPLTTRGPGSCCSRPGGSASPRGPWPATS